MLSHVYPVRLPVTVNLRTTHRPHVHSPVLSLVRRCRALFWRTPHRACHRISHYYRTTTHEHYPIPHTYRFTIPRSGLLHVTLPLPDDHLTLHRSPQVTLFWTPHRIHRYVTRYTRLRSHTTFTEDCLLVCLLDSDVDLPAYSVIDYILRFAIFVR